MKEPPKQVRHDFEVLDCRVKPDNDMRLLRSKMSVSTRSVRLIPGLDPGIFFKPLQEPFL